MGEGIFSLSFVEILLILFLAFLLLRSDEYKKIANWFGRMLNQLVRSDSWRIFQQTSSEIRNLPRSLMREANMEMMEAEKELRRVIDPRNNPPVSRSSPTRSAPPSNEKENPLPADFAKPTENGSDENA